MEQKTLARWLKIIIIGIAVCGLIVYGMVIPAYGTALKGQNPEYAWCYVPWLIFIWLTAIPCFGILLCGWKVAGNIGLDRSFSEENALLLRRIAWLAAGDSAFFFVGNIVYLFLNMNHPGIVILSLLVEFAGIAVSVAAAALSHLVQKAAVLQEQSDLTI
ncbi:MAG: DUF2975 domain-containing protein [Clostridiales bacterium]|nr:DUF2975 domain-containing protein [Clostridiales bacterium]